MIDKETIESIRKKFNTLENLMDERMRRYWAASEALNLGWGGIRAVAKATGISKPTIQAGLAEIQEPIAQTQRKSQDKQKVRRPGGGRKKLTQQDPKLLRDLQSLLEPVTRGDPQSPLLWTCKSTRNLAEELVRLGHQVSHDSIGRLLEDIGYSLQVNNKSREGEQHPDRDAQFAYINKHIKSFQRRGQPVVSVDAKKKELIGDFRNSGREWHPTGEPELVRTHDFEDRDLGKGIPYGVYDLTKNNGWVSVGIDHDTAQFAIATLLRWWKNMGSKEYPHAKELLITADAGGSNSTRSRLWKVSLQDLADSIGLKITVCHFPPGTSKWNKIEHRMFCHITGNWRGKPLTSLAVVVNLIGNTKTRTGLRVKADLDTNNYETGIKVSDDELASIRIRKASFHGDWNYTILPRV
jgi:transposase